MLVKAWVIPLVYLDFEIRRDYIVANLCENRDKPILLCNGKCFLTKKLDQAQKQEESRAEKTYLANLIYQVMDDQKTFNVPAPLVSVEILPQIAFQYHSSLLSSANTHDVFRPPLV